MAGVALHGLAFRQAAGLVISQLLTAEVGSETVGGGVVTSRGTRSCSSSSVAWIIGSAWKRARITPSSRVSAIAVIVMPWWWAMKARTMTQASPAGTRMGVKSTAS